VNQTAAVDSFWDAVRRIPTADKIVRNRLLNQLGCQVGRVVAAEALVRLRRRRFATGLSAAEAALLRDGVAVIDDFVARAEFEALLEEADRGERRFFTKRPTADKFGIVRQKVSVRKHAEHFPVAIRTLLDSEPLLRLARIAEGWSDNDDFNNRETGLTYERLDQVTDPDARDAVRDREISSGDLHADTFHYVTKAFLTLDDITLINSPYTYALGSQRLTPSRLLWEYRNSLRPEQYVTSEYHNRVWEAEQHRLGIRPEPLEVRRNALIVTNTFGFHRRGPMTRQGAVRRMLRLDFRSNPFRVASNR
jgi:hypothetical protein